MSKTLVHKSNFTLLNDGLDYENKVHEILKKFQHEDLEDEIARKWIARSICQIYEEEASNITDKQIEDRRMAM